MNTPNDASDEQIAKLFGDELKPLEAMAKAIDRVNELMRPALNAEMLMSGRANELPVIDLRGRDIRYECHGSFRGKAQWACWDAKSYDGDESEMGFGDSMEMALTDLMEKLDPPEPEPKPRMRLIDGGGGVQPPEYADDYQDPDAD